MTKSAVVDRYCDRLADAFTRGAVSKQEKSGVIDMDELFCCSSCKVVSLFIRSLERPGVQQHAVTFGTGPVGLEVHAL